MRGGNVMTMARDPRDLKRLADELARLSPDERARVFADVALRSRWRPLPRDFQPPVFPRSGGRWIGGNLSREELYGDDGR
jgi:hypothetical protein